MKGKKLTILSLLFLLTGSILYFQFMYLKPVESQELEDGTKVKFRTSENTIEVYQDESWSSMFVKGVNLGATVPGHYPGALAIEDGDYHRWFKKIQDMGVNTIRIYTIHEPEFYEALVQFNQKHPDNPLYFMQGVWTPVNELNEQEDAMNDKVTKQFKEELKRAVGAVYGDITIPERDGKASGDYTANAGQYLLAWHIGTEWAPTIVENTNEKHKEAPAVKGDHFQTTKDAEAYEKWLAELLEYTAKLEEEKGWQHPMTFTNWVTTDPLEHPKEPLINEDLVGVDATNIKTKNWEAGYFASYHAYPYYPDFFRYSEKYQDVKNDEGKADSYKGYLRELKDYHDGMPIMITEFGVPSSLGNAHKGALGRDQGGHTEQEQGDINAELLRHIHEEGYAGAALFTWQDEWFKKTWNTMPFENKNSRAYWYNYLSNEMSFGVLGMYPGKEEAIEIDGSREDWQELNEEEVQKQELNADGWDSLWITHDEGYVYINARLQEDFNPEEDNLFLGVDTLSGGVTKGDILPKGELDKGLETLIRLGRKEESEVLIASDYDYHNRLYGNQIGEAETKNETDTFTPWRLAVSLKLEPPNANYSLPFEEVSVGKLPRGTAGDFQDKNYQSQALWQTKGNIVEAKIPWALLGFSDPSSQMVVSYENHDKESSELKSKKAEGIRLVPWMEKNGSETQLSWKESTTPHPVSELPKYEWESWTEVDYVERKKQSYYDMQEAFQAINKVKQ
ncbi:hypothetical protein ACFFGV_16235 [Pontibacillus salicampi]|uniref:Family 2 glycosyl transferase n=1 Tax=Pontibacillus salicampi TaxID=1449801 RepID=A0ABV6LRU6_9BACI